MNWKRTSRLAHSSVLFSSCSLPWFPLLSYLHSSSSTVDHHPLLPIHLLRLVHLADLFVPLDSRFFTLMITYILEVPGICLLFFRLQVHGYPLFFRHAYVPSFPCGFGQTEIDCNKAEQRSNASRSTRTTFTSFCGIGTHPSDRDTQTPPQLDQSTCVPAEHPVLQATDQ